MKYPIAIEPGDATHAWGVVVPDLPGCFSAADSGIDEAIENAKEAITAWIEAVMECGKADGTSTQHKNVMELVRTYLSDLEEFRGVAFQTLPFETAGGTQKREVAILNEQQSTLLLTYMRNSEIVRAFKKRLLTSSPA